MHPYWMINMLIQMVSNDNLPDCLMKLLIYRKLLIDADFIETIVVILLNKFTFVQSHKFIALLISHNDAISPGT